MKSTTEKSRDKENKKKEMVTFGGGGTLKEVLTAKVAFE